MEQKPPTQFVDTSETVRALIDVLSTVEAESGCIHLDLEGVALSPHGSISIIQAWIPTLEQAFIVDVHTLGAQVQTHKVLIFDVRNDADALFKAGLAGIMDIQLLELASRKGSRDQICGLAACLKQEKVLPRLDQDEWQSRKTKVTQMFDPRLGGSYAVWNVRPLPQILTGYGVADVQLLPALPVRTKSAPTMSGWKWFARNSKRDR
ncbi:Uu.00g078850.m01.CDS01 [Anthostomella pinea]|uniref:Uu.00g078850.m01.CDS01 n=1 Tax=Anthostomella pinea TaxID=933095 RepID=A0AAI8VKM9_9PEZI|nr:Uu.00g078850.m01.CDS01 [Anthostomella pinea]